MAIIMASMAMIMAIDGNDNGHRMPILYGNKQWAMHGKHEWPLMAILPGNNNGHTGNAKGP